MMEIIFFLLILPFQDTFHLVRVMDERIEVLSEINIKNRNNKEDLILYTYNEQYAAFLKKNRILVYNISSNEKPELIRKIKIINNLKPFCLALQDHYLYTGGRWHGKSEKRTHFSAGFYNLQEKKPEWMSISVPGEYIWAGKAIDDILVQPGSLLLVDNLVYPKYLLPYTLISGGTMEPGKAVKLAANGPNERIEKGFLTGHYFAFISTTFGSWDFGYHINIYKREDYTRVLSIGSSKNSMNDFIIAGNRLYIILNCYTIGSLDIKDNLFIKTKHDFASMHLDLDKEEDLDKITVKKYDHFMTRLVPLPGRADGFIIIYEKNEEYGYCLLLNSAQQ